MKYNNSPKIPYAKKLISLKRYYYKKTLRKGGLSYSIFRDAQDGKLLRQFPHQHRLLSACWQFLQLLLWKRLP
jgi:hypothetical protein